MVLHYINEGDATPPGYRRIREPAEVLEVYGGVLGWTDIKLADKDFVRHTGVPPECIENSGGLRYACSKRRPVNHCILPPLIRALPDIEALLEGSHKKEES